MKCQMDYMESIKKLEEKWSAKQQKHVVNGEVRGCLLLLDGATPSS